MAGTVHDVENKDLLAQVKEESANAARQLAEAARLHKGQLVVVGCSTSEVVGKKVGSWSTPEVAAAIFEGLNSVFAPMGVYIAAQCCEHLNRALIVEHEAVPNGEIVNVKPAVPLPRRPIRASVTRWRWRRSRPTPVWTSAARSSVCI